MAASTNLKVIAPRPAAPGRRRRRANHAGSAASASRLPSLLNKRLLFVTGKGGVGKTTVAAALGLASARAGKRTLVCELHEQGQVSAMLGHDASVEEHEIAPNLYAVTVDPEQAMAEYLMAQVKIKPLHDILFKNRIFEHFAAAMPGLYELCSVAKIWEMAQEQRSSKGASAYDVVIVDAPATGHGVALLEVPETYRDIARVGRMHREAERLLSFLKDPKMTGVVAVTTPEELPVNETCTLRAKLASKLKVDFSLVIVNALRPEVFSKDQTATIAALTERPPAIDAAITEHGRALNQLRQLRRLRKQVKRPFMTLPFIYTESLDRRALDTLADQLAEVC